MLALAPYLVTFTNSKSQRFYVINLESLQFKF